MASSLVWTLLLCAAALTAAKPKSPRIVGGVSTTIEQYPWIVAVESLGLWSGTWMQTCAASIVTSRWVISAAHCFDGILYSPEYRRIRAGSTYRNTGGVVSNVLREINYPFYGVAARHDGDINVVEIETALVWGTTIQQGIIVAPGSVLPDGLPVVLAGWGATDLTGPYAEELQQVTVVTINSRVCAERYFELNESVVTENMICSGLLDVGGQEACHGDSGGPVYYGNIIVGVISWGHSCANGTYPGVNTAVSSYTNWIIANIN